MAKPGGASVTIIDPDLGGSCKSSQVETSVLDQGLVTGASSGPGGLGFTFPSPGGFTAEVTTAKPTKLFIIGALDVTARCASTDPCALRFMLHVDGEQVRETLRSFPGTTAGKEASATAFAVVDVGAGEHIVHWRSGIFGEQFNSTTATWVGAIALGG